MDTTQGSLSIEDKMMEIQTKLSEQMFHDYVGNNSVVIRGNLVFEDIIVDGISRPELVELINKVHRNAQVEAAKVLKEFGEGLTNKPSV